MLKKPDFTLGIEEEYLLVDADSRALIVETPKGFLDACKAELGTQVSPEFLQCQVEIGTRVCQTAAEAKSELMYLRRVIIDIAKSFYMRVIAASTHPFSHAEDSKHTPKTRYHQLASDLQAVVRNLQISGMHIHCGLGDNDDLRIDFMEQVAYILPHLLALTTSSPFWGGEDTGLKSYRLAIWDQMPRTGLPGHFESYGEYQRYVDVLVKTGVIEDATKVWWDIRPSDRFPTLEMRITDICTRVEDAICIAAMYQCWLHMLWRLKKDNMKWRRYSRMLINENRWRAQRYGIDQGLIDFGEQSIESFPDLIEEMQEFLLEDAQLLDCVDEIQHARSILANGTSAHRQLAVYQQALASGKDKQAALVEVVDSLVIDTQYGMDVVVSPTNCHPLDNA